MPEGIALAKAAVPVLRERGMLRYRVLDPQPTKPAIRQVQMHFFAKAALRTDPKTITNYQHADHQLRIDRWSAGMAIKRGEISAQIRQVEKLINAAKQMIGWNVVVKVERVEQTVLIAAVVSHHLSSPH